MEVPKNSFTQVLRDKLFELVKEFDAVIKPGDKSQIIYLGTPQNEMSLYNELQERGYTCTIYPARYPYDDAHRKTYGNRLASIIATRYEANKEALAGQPTDPLRFDDVDLQKRELSYGKAGFLLQFMLDTSLNDANKYPLKLRDLLVGTFDTSEAPLKLSWLPDTSKKIDPNTVTNLGMRGDGYFYFYSASDQMQPYGHKIMSVDPSGRGTDETSYSVLYWLNGYIYVMEVGGLTSGYSDATLEKLSRVAKKWKVNEVVIEGNYGDGMFTKLLEPVLKSIYGGCGCTEVKSKGQKELRIIDTLEPVISNHKLVVTPECIQQDASSVPESNFKYSCFYQMTHITRDKGALLHDDRLDALAQGVAYLIDFMGIDADEGINDVTAQWLEDSLESFFGFVSEDISSNIKDTTDRNEYRASRGAVYYSRGRSGYK